MFLITFSVVEPASFDNAVNKVNFYYENKFFKKWYPELKEMSPNVPKIFIGNKIDLREESLVNSGAKNAPIGA